MTLLQALEGRTLHWCLRTSPADMDKTIADLPMRVRKLTEQHSINFVPVQGFDHLMAALWKGLAEAHPKEFPDLLDALKQKQELRVKAHEEQRSKLFGSDSSTHLVTAKNQVTSVVSDSASADQTAEVLDSLKVLVGEEGARRKQKPWWRYQEEIDAMSDTPAKDIAYKAAIEALPLSAPLLGHYASFLRSVPQRHDEAETYYQRALEVDVTHARSLGNYANFLTVVRQRHDEAETYYQRALEADPTDAHNLGNYAIFLTDVRRRHHEAETFYQRALAADPKHVNSLGSYANFLRSVRQRHDEAETYYQRALEADPTHAINLGNYAGFLSNVRQRHDEAETYFQRAIEADPKRVNNLGNYANFLRRVRQRYDEAETYFQRAVEADPKHANNLGNYANFLTGVRQRHDEAETYYQRALAADPKHATLLGNYASSLSGIRQRHDEAETYYQLALEADPKYATLLGNYASFLTSVRQRHDEAETYYQRALEADPTDANTLGNYAQLLLVTGRAAEGLKKLTAAEQSDPKSPDLAVDLAFYRYAHDVLQRPQALDRLKALASAGARSPAWNLVRNIEQAERDGHPNVPLLKALDAVITRGADPATLDAFPEFREA